MRAVPVAPPARWGHLAVEDEHMLLELAELPGDMGDVALDALTHLPLRVEAWERVRSLLREELAVTGQGERRHFLWRVLRWVPVFEPGDAFGDNGESETQDRFIRLVRRDPDLAWIRAPAPGFLSVDADVREAALAVLVPKLDALAHELEARGPFRLSDQELAIGELDPIAVTALFESAASADYYRIQVGNALVAHIATLPAAKHAITSTATGTTTATGASAGATAANNGRGASGGKGIVSASGASSAPGAAKGKAADGITSAGGSGASSPRGQGIVTAAGTGASPVAQGVGKAGVVTGAGVSTSTSAGGGAGNGNGKAVGQTK